jgi:[ribosomal protein S5]-alanine N-acetyltransferase
MLRLVSSGHARAREFDRLSRPIHTARMCLRTPNSQDASRLAALMTPTVSRWLASWPYPLTEATVRKRIASWRLLVAEGRAFQRVLERQADHAVMGWISVSRPDVHSRRGSMGYWLNDAYQGQGYMTEAAQAALRAAFALLDLDVVEAGAQLENDASFAVMRRLGMVHSSARSVWTATRQRDEPCAFYEVSKEAFIQADDSLQKPVSFG